MQTGLMLLSACVLGVMGLGLTGCGENPQANAQGAMAGEALFSAQCAMCHRSGGAGKLDPATWQAGQDKLENEKVFRAYLRDTGNVMPSIPEPVLSDKEVGVLYAYLVGAEKAQRETQP